MTQYSKIIGKRTLRPVLWNLLLQAGLLCVFIFFNCASLFHPLNWIYDWYVNFLRLGSWLYFLPLTFMVILLASASTEDYVNIQPFYESRISLIQQALNIHNVLIGGLHICIGFLIPWAYSSMIGPHYDQFTYTCKDVDNKLCLSEKRFFLVLGGMWVSLLHFFHGHFFGTRYLKFPIAQLPKLILIKSQFLETFRKAMRWIITPVSSFIVLYYLKFGSLLLQFSDTFGFRIEEERIDSVSGLINMSLLIYLCIFSVLIAVTVRFMELFSRVYLTERYIFSFNTSLDGECPSLTDALKVTDYPIIQHLAFLDLMLLTNHNKSRREEIYKLSSFGGHPHLWFAIKEGCIEIIHQLITELEMSMKTPLPVTTPLVKNRKPPIRRNVPDYFAGYNSSLITEINDSPSNPKEINLPDIDPDDNFESEFTEWLMSIRIVAFIFGSRKDMKIRHSLRMCSPVKWACESLSFLACHSVKEDKYGVLVSDLGIIIKLLLNLKLTLENLNKFVSHASSLTDQDMENLSVALDLKKSVKRSIYRIVNTFKNYLSDIPIEKEVEYQLRPFLSYRE